MNSRRDDNFLNMVRNLATPRWVHITFADMLEGPEKTWPHPETVEQVAQAEAVRARRRQGLGSRITDSTVLGRVVSLVRGQG